MNKRLLIVICLLALIPLAAVALLYGSLPEQIPTQWNINGSVTYSARSTIFLIAGLSPVMAVLLLVLPRVDPRKKNYEKFRSYYDAFIVVLLLFLLVMDGIILSESLQPGRISVSRVVVLGVGLLFVFLGNILPRIKNNFFMGLRTPWTLSDPDVWNRAHRLGGKLFFWFGLAIALSGLLLPEAVTFVLVMICVATVSGIPAVMS
jgi:uncharacterized membrane protein